MTNKEAIAILTHNWKYRELIDNSYQYEALDLAIKALEERPQGKWYYSIERGWHCSECDEVVKDMPTCMRKATYKFCPNCGATMVKEAHND